MPTHPNPSDEVDLKIDRLANEFVERIRLGDPISIDQYVRENPELAPRIRRVFPALMAMESVALVVSDESGSEPCAGTLSTRYIRIGDYQIIRQIGQGGMGVVYLAEQTGTERLVALKILPEHVAGSDENRERFEKEARATARLQHPNIVPIFEFGIGEAVSASGDATNLYYFSMQYVKGRSLSELIKALSSRKVEAGATSRDLTTADYQTRSNFELEDPHTPCYKLNLSSETIGNQHSKTKPDQEFATNDPPGSKKQSPDMFPDLAVSNPHRWKQIARMGMQAADALAHSHNNEILHRDIKPSNLMIDQEGKIWIADFGLAKFIDQEKTSTNGMAGTLRFMAPERFDGWSDPRSDIYSLGITLYELTTLRPAIAGSERPEIVRRIERGEITRPGKAFPKIPRDLETIILKSIEIEPGDRYQSAIKLHDDLRRFVEDRPVLARRIGIRDRTRSWARRNPFSATLVAAVGILLLLLSLGSTLVAFRLDGLAGELENEKDNANRSLLLAYESEAHSRTISRRVGHKLKAFEAIGHAIELLPDVEHDQDDLLRLRNEAIAALALTDIELVREFPVGGSAAHPSPNFKYFAYSSANSLFQLADAQTGKRVWSFQFQANENINPCHVVPYFSPNSKYVAGYVDSVDKLRLFEVESGNLLLELDYQPLGVFAPVAFSNDGNWFAVSGASNPIRLFDLRDLQRPPRQIDVPFGINQLAFDHNDNTLFGSMAFQDPGKLFAWEIKTGQSNVIEINDDVTRWLPTKFGMVVGDFQGHTKVYPNWPDTKLEATLDSSPSDVGYLHANKDASLLCTQAWSQGYQIIDLATGNQILEIWGLWPKFSDDGHQLADTFNGKIRFFKIHKSNRHLSSGANANRFEDFGIRFDPSGELFVTASGVENQIWDARKIRKLGSDTNVKYQHGSASFLEDGRVICATNNKVTIYEVKRTGDRVKLINPESFGEVYGDWRAVAASRRNQMIAWRSKRYTIKVAKLSDWKNAIEIETAQTPFAPFFDFSPDGRILAVSENNIKLYDTGSGKLIHDFGVESAGTVRAFFNFSPDGKRMLSTNGRQQLLFDLENKQLIKRFDNSCEKGGAEFSPDGRIIALALDAETVVLRNADSFDELARLRLPRRLGIQTVRFTPDGKSIIVNGNLKQFHRFDLFSIRNELDELKLNW